jgi:hypothetical protein
MIKKKHPLKYVEPFIAAGGGVLYGARGLFPGQISSSTALVIALCFSLPFAVWIYRHRRLLTRRTFPLFF